MTTLRKDDDKRMKLRYAGVCRLCGTVLPARGEAIFDRVAKTVRCVACRIETAEAVGVATGAMAVEARPEDSGVAGSSARREYERRKAKDEERLRQKWGKLGGMTAASRVQGRTSTTSPSQQPASG